MQAAPLDDNPASSVSAGPPARPAEAFEFAVCRVEVDHEARLVRTTFADGAEAVSAPNYGPEDRARARALGYAGDDPVWEMTSEHDLAHAALADAEGEASYVMRQVALGEPIVNQHVAALEERRVLLLQRVSNEGLRGAAR